MTSQVILLNNTAIALASDSTITTQDSDSRQRTANSSEKIFAVGGAHNLAVLGSGNADIGVFPVDALLSEWERTLKSTLPTVNDYAISFIEWLRTSEAFKQEEMEKRLVLNMLDEIISPAYHAIKNFCEPRELTFESDASDFSTEIHQFIAEQVEHLKDWDYYQHADDKWVEKTVIDFKDSIAAKIEWWINDIPNLPTIADSMWGLARMGLGRKTGLSPAGIVFVGFGDNQLLPAYSYVDIYGVARGVVFFREIQQYAQTNQQGWYRFLAQAEAQRSLLDGISDNMSTSTKSFIKDEVAELKNKLAETLPESESSAWEVTFDEHASSIAASYHDVIRSSRNANDEKLQDVIRLAPESDLALLASMFVSIEAFSQLIASPQPTVGGPIDVAVMSKRHGFRWVKHKNLEVSSIAQF